MAHHPRRLNFEWYSWKGALNRPRISHYIETWDDETGDRTDRQIWRSDYTFVWHNECRECILSEQVRLKQSGLDLVSYCYCKHEDKMQHDRWYF
jgi:hypothetical protein